MNNHVQAGSASFLAFSRHRLVGRMLEALACYIKGCNRAWFNQVRRGKDCHHRLVDQSLIVDLGAQN